MKTIKNHCGQQRKQERPRKTRRMAAGRKKEEKRGAAAAGRNRDGELSGNVKVYDACKYRFTTAGHQNGETALAEAPEYQSTESHRSQPSTCLCVARCITNESVETRLLKNCFLSAARRLIRAGPGRAERGGGTGETERSYRR
jgi:hypothetical protein